MSQVATYRDKRQVVAKTYAPGGCPVHLGKQKCGETQGLDIIMDFHKLYQEKMSEIDVSAGGDSLQEKVSLQEQWINDLTEQNKLLAKVIEELESETIGRVQQLEDKLNNAVKSIGEDDKPALPEKQKKIEEPKKTPVTVPPVEDDLKKKTEENDRLKQPEAASEKEIKNHSMSKADIELKDIKPKTPPKKTKTPEPSEGEDDAGKLTEVLKPAPEPSLAPSSKAPSQSLLFNLEEDASQQAYHKERVTSKVSSRRSVHLLLDDDDKIVEPEKDFSTSLNIPDPPSTMSIPMVGTKDSLELIRKASQASQKPKDDNVCVCVEKDFWDELTQLKEENQKLKEGGELQRMKKEVEEKMKRILELNEENRTLNDMINMLRTNQTGKKLQPPSDSEPMSSDSDYCTGGCEPTRSPIKPPSAKRRLSARDRDPKTVAPKTSMKQCLCEEDCDKYCESPPFIDVYKREDKGRFVSDSSSTVCNEEICAFLRNLTPLEYRARGGYDCSDCTDCACPPGGPLPDFQGGGVCEECDDRTCPNKDFYDQPVQTVDRGGPPAAPASNAPFPITCTDDTCTAPECSAKMGDAMPQSQGYGPASDFPITCDDDTCQVPDCSAKTGGVAPPQPIYVAQGGAKQDAGVMVSCDAAPECACVNQGSYPMQIDAKCACMSGIAPTQAAPGVPKTPSECICSVPEECQTGGAATRTGDGKCPRGTCETCVCATFPLPDAKMHFTVPPPAGGGGGGQCPRGICEFCACMKFPGVKAGGGARALPAGLVIGATTGGDTCAICGCELSPSDIMVAGEVCGSGPSGVAAPGKATGAAGAVGPLTTNPCPDEICTEPCSCKAVYSDTGPIGGGGLKRAGGPKGAVGPLTTNPCPDEICPEPCSCKVTQSEPYIDPDDPRPVRVSPAAVGGDASCDPCNPCVCDEGGGAKAGPASTGKSLAPITEDLCPDEICEKPCTCKVVPSEGYIDSDTDLRKRQIPGAATQTAVMEKASECCSAICGQTTGQATMTETEVCSVMCQSTAVDVSEPCGAPCGLGMDAPTGASDSGVCGDSTCTKRYPKGGTMSSSSPGSKPRPPPPGGDDGMGMIRCSCKSKFCKLVPDPDNPGQQMCVDASGANQENEGSCVCASCPEPETPANPPEGSCCMAADQVPTQPPVMTVNQLYKVTKTPENLSKEQEYAGLSRKDSATRRTGYIAPRKALSTFGIMDVDDEELTGNEESRNADLKLIIADLKSKLLDAEDKIEELKLGKNYSDKDNDTSIKWSKKEREEYEYLKQRVKHLEQGKGDTENITSNLQTAVDLYVDTIEVLEASEEKLKAELEHYKDVNEVLHENILSMREEIEMMKDTFQQELDDLKWNNFISHIENEDVQYTNEIYLQQINKYQNLYQQMMELNYELEMEHVNNLQDLSMMEAQFNKYQSVVKNQEEEKIVIRNQLKKLTKKNKCYEEVVQFFKDEMSVMSDELLTLQEVLNVTNVSSLEENNKLIGAILQLRRINDRLVAHLCAIEKQAIIENQINQINEARINELQNIISAKNNDLTQHDDIIQDMRRKLNNATRQNADLKKTIKNLTDTVVEIQEGIKSVEREQLKNVSDVSVVESKVCLASGDLESIKICMEQKNSRIMELENQLKSQEVELILANKELGMLKEKKSDSKEVINSLKEQLTSAEKRNEQVVGDYQMVVKKLQDYSNLEHMKNYELNHYKSLVEEMKTSLVQLNNGLEKCEASNIHFYEDLRNSDHMRGRLLQHRKNNLPIVFDELKKSMADLKRRLSEADFKGGLIEEELLKVKESHMSQITEEVTDTQKELEAKIISSIEEQSRLNQIVEDQKEEIRRLKRELEKEKADICACKRSVSDLKNEKTSTNAEVEISQLKSDLNKSLHRQRLLNEENDQIHTQMINLRKKLTFLEQAYDVLKQENEDYKTQLKRALREKEYLSSKNHDLTKTIEQMRSTHDQLEKQCRYNADRLRNLELELADAQVDREIVSDEAKHLASAVKTWIEEQPNENLEIRGKIKNNTDTINPLRKTMMKKMSEEKSWINTPMQHPFSPRRYGTMGNLERRTVSPARTRRMERHTAEARYRSSSPWREMNSYDEYVPEDTNSHKSNILRNISYDSNSSPYTSRSLSPRTASIQGEDDEMDEMNLNDWFSPNYKETETDADEGDEDSFINKVQLMTAQVQEANIRWQQKMNKEYLSKSRASNK
ncbi:uncharacterized protein LOC123679064 isoform X2 [Harmonia axyridis]|uniref:uncharacterized protein LOC123679064 isoform X2 n=1 Tax=Harmonia axyridis TaxID=115357 RepID=UPI001E2753B3|nr:uncharacterized protein LOC123679064 isoform X2 [Harmonia axyridis]